MIALLCAGAIILCLMKVYGPSQTLDARLFYDQMEAWSFFQTLGTEESARYFVNELLDLCFIAVYSSIFYLSLQRLNGWKKPWLAIALIPGLFDWIETTWILFILKAGQISGPMLWLGWFTLMKWVCVIVMICVLVGLKIRSRKKCRPN